MSSKGPHAFDSWFQPPVWVDHKPAPRLGTLGKNGSRKRINVHELLGLPVVDKGQGVHFGRRRRGSVGGDDPIGPFHSMENAGIPLYRQGRELVLLHRLLLLGKWSVHLVLAFTRRELGAHFGVLLLVHIHLLKQSAVWKVVIFVFDWRQGRHWKRSGLRV